MRNDKLIILAVTATFTTVYGICAQSSQAADTVPVTVENFVRAETHLYFGNSVNAGGFGGFHHIRELLPIDH